MFAIHQPFQMIICLIFLLFLPGALCLLGYNCGGDSFNVIIISFLDVGECRVSEEKPNSTSTYIQLLQIAEHTLTKVITCRVEVDRQIFHCGMHSHVSLVQGGHRKYLVDLDQSACSRLHDTRAFTYTQGAVVSGLVPNTTNYRTLTLAGATATDGTCNGAQFTDAYGTWNNVIVEASMYFTFKDYYATVKVEHDTLLLRSGTHCRASELTCIDEDGANVFWSPLPNDKCQFHAYDVLYQGFADRIIDNDSRYPVIYTLASNQATFALSKKSERIVCGYTLIQTEHPKLIIVETSRDDPFAKQARVLVENLDAFIYLNSKFVYVEKHLKTQIRSLYQNVIYQKCQLERQVLRNALASATLQPDLFAYHLMKGPGYIATVAGEVAHIIKCIPVDVTRRSTESCYLELPVITSNRSMFLAPRTRMLIKTGTPIDCNPILPTMYSVAGGWISLTPKPAAVIPPQNLEPLTHPTWKYVDAEHLADSGIYSNEDLTRLREHIMFPIEQPTLVHNLAKAAAGHRIPASGISITNLLDDDALNFITKSTAEKLFGGFLQFGTISAGFIGVWLLIRGIKLIADTLIHGYALHSVYGWSLHLLGAFFSSITNLLLHLGRRPLATSPARPQLRGRPADIPPAADAVCPTSEVRISISADEPTNETEPIPQTRQTPASRKPPHPNAYPVLPQGPINVDDSLARIENRLAAYLPPASR